ncbi:MAG: PQQ-binding-like beta-propeller repeat protein [Bacteroidales bacterium]|nr:PQQ-binding-like beta-propeller repeat protein [Bacteroidales bacterium]
MVKLMNLKNLLWILVFISVFGTFSCSRSSKPIDVEPFRFAYLADLHISAVEANVEDLRTSVADIVAQDSLDFVIFAGDITEFGSDQELALAKEIMDELDIPYYILSGNHDSKWSESGVNTFVKVFGYEYFHFVKNGVHFIGTNSGPNMRMMPALVPREAMVWLDSVTSAIPAHAPVINVNHYPLDDAMLNYSDVLDLLRRTNIQLSMCGHGHSNRALDFDGVRGVMGRSNLRAGKVAAGKAGYNIVTVAGDSLTMTVRAGGVTEEEPWFSVKLLSRAQNPSVGVVAPVDSLMGRTFVGGAPGSVVAGEAGVSGEAGDAGEAGVSAAGEAGVSGDAAGVAGEAAVSADFRVGTVWEFRDNSDIGSAPAYAFGNVYVANTAGVVKALHGETGDVLWSYATGGKVFSTPEVDPASGILVVGSSDNFIYGLDASSGELRWRVEAGKSVLGSPAIYEGVAFIGASDGVFRAIEVASGEVVWSFDGVSGFVESRPWVDAEGVYFGDWANNVYALDVRSGELLWKWNNNRGRGLSAAAVWPVKADGKLFVVTPERRVHALDAGSGSELWAHRGGREAIGLSEDGSAVYIKTMQDTVIAFSSGDYRRAGLVSRVLGGSSGGSGDSRPGVMLGGARGADGGVVGVPEILWESHTGYGYEIAPSPITSAYGLVFIPTDKGNIFALNAGDGSVAWSYRFAISLVNYVRPVGDGRVLVSSMDGKVGLLQVR